MSSRYTHTITASCTSGPEEEGRNWPRIFKRTLMGTALQLYIAGNIAGAEYPRPSDQGSRVAIFVSETIWVFKEGVKADWKFARSMIQNLRQPDLPPNQKPPPSPTPTPCPSPVSLDIRIEIETCEDCPDEYETHRAPCHK